MMANSLKMLKNWLKNQLLSSSALQSFTYYIPGPPKREEGYREKQFDMILNKILSSGMTIHSLKMQSHSSSHGASGLWVHCLLRGEAEKLDRIQREWDECLFQGENTNMAIEIERAEIQGPFHTP